MTSDYKKLAYERAVLMALVGLAKEKFLPLEGETDPEHKIECEELPRSESSVPEDAVIDVVLKLQRLAANRELEMSKYKFVATEKNDEQEWAEAEERPRQGGGQKPEAPAKQGKNKGRAGGPQAPAAGGGRQKPAPPGAQSAPRAPVQGSQ